MRRKRSWKRELAEKIVRCVARRREKGDAWQDIEKPVMVLLREKYRDKPTPS